ncbi:uncharacterized protein [Chironomus tepperi]|uniref:uncharacterized protein n=1 Tax=Chironomus tepperi TaxID=113505 RepID=UPI00391F9CFD
MLQQAPYVGFTSYDPSAFGDIVILAKGKLKKFANETYLFEEIHDVCEYQCQNNADKYLENVTALWMVERIRHRDAERQYRYDLKFTIVPIFSGRNALIKSNNLEERLRNILKKTFILRDTDYPKYFQQIVPKIARRADINRSMPGYVTPNHLNHHPYSYSHPPKMHHLNMGEFMKKQAYVVPKPPSLNNYYVQNVNRYPIRFPDSRENFSSLKASPYRVKLPIKEEEERQEAHIVNNVVDHRGAVDLGNKQTAQSFANFNSQQSHSNVNNSPLKPLPARSTGLFMSQPAILLPQMPISLFHVAPYTIPLHLQVSTPANQMLYAQQPDVTTFRYPNFHNSHQVIPNFQYLQNKSNPFKESERIVPQQSYSLPDPVYHSTTTTTEKPIFPTMYTPKLSNYVTASSIQINSYDNNDFQPIVSPFSSKNKYDNKKIVFSSDEKIQSKTTKYQTRHATNSKERVRSTSTTTEATTSSSTTDLPRNNQQLDYANYDIVATRPSLTKKTTEKPILKWLPKRHRNKTLTNVITTQAPTKSSFSASIETSSQSSIHPTIKASTSTHSQIFRGRNRFYSNKRNSSTSTVTEKSTALSTNLNQNLSKQFKRKSSLTTTLLPITTQSPINAQTTTIFPTYSVTSYYETKEPITSQSYSTSVSLQVDGDKVDTTASYELLPASVETIHSNSTNIKIYRASAIAEDVDVNDDRLNIDEIASTILKHAKSTDNVKKSINKN